MAAYKLDRTLHLTHAPGDPEAKAVEESDPEGHYVLGGAGSEIPDVDAKRYGLLKDKEDAAAEAKAVDGKSVRSRSAQNKAMQPQEDK